MEALQSVAVVAALAATVADFEAAVAVAAVKEGEAPYDFFVSKAVVEVPLMAVVQVHQNQFVAAVAVEGRRHHLQSSRYLHCSRRLGCWRLSRHSPNHLKSVASIAQPLLQQQRHLGYSASTQGWSLTGRGRPYFSGRPSFARKCDRFCPKKSHIVNREYTIQGKALFFFSLCLSLSFVRSLSLSLSAFFNKNTHTLLYALPVKERRMANRRQAG